MEFKLPAIGEGVVEGEIVRWLKKPGDHVAANEPLVEVMTDKATVEIPSPQDAVVERIVSDEGAIAAVGAVIAILTAGASATASTPRAATPTNGTPPHAETPIDESRGKVLATPAARALARDSGIDLAQVTGDHGRITKAHVELARGSYSAAPTVPVSDSERPTILTGQREATPVDPSNSRPTERPSSTATQLPTGPRPATGPGPATGPQAATVPRPVARAGLGAPPPDEFVPFRGIRRKIAEGLHKSYSTAVHYTYVEQLDVTKLVAVREQAKKAAAEEGVSLSYLPFIVKAVIRGLRKYPIVNAELDEPNARVIVKKRYSIGVATATEHGLMVPVVHDADRLSLLDIAVEIARVSEAARTGKASREELTGSTFTISSLGQIGGLLATPILNYPEVGILGVHAIRKVPVVGDDDQIRIGHVMNLSVSLDHRVVDGFEGASFLQEVKRHLEDPTLLLLTGI